MVSRFMPPSTLTDAGREPACWAAVRAGCPWGAWWERTLGLGWLLSSCSSLPRRRMLLPKLLGCLCHLAREGVALKFSATTKDILKFRHTSSVSLRDRIG